MSSTKLTAQRRARGLLRDRVRDVSQARTLATWLAGLEHRFAQRILPVDTRVAQEWGRLNVLTPRNSVDSLIAATALVHGLTVVTRNTADFEGCEAPLVNPWDFRSPDSV